MSPHLTPFDLIIVIFGEESASSNKPRTMENTQTFTGFVVSPSEQAVSVFNLCYMQIFCICPSCSWIAVQGVSGTRRSADGETEAEANSYDIHIGAAQGTGTGVPGDPLPRYLHARGDRYEDRFDRGEGAGKRKRTLASGCTDKIKRISFHCL